MCWSRLSFVLRPPWTPERPRYPIRLKVRLMDCPGRAGEGSDVPSSDTSRMLVLPSCSEARALRCSVRTPARPQSPAPQRFTTLL